MPAVTHGELTRPSNCRQSVPAPVMLGVAPPVAGMPGLPEYTKPEFSPALAKAFLSRKLMALAMAASSPALAAPAILAAFIAWNCQPATDRSKRSLFLVYP